MGAMELQIFVSLLVVLGAAFVALICDFLKGNNEKLREVNIELLVRQEERERAGQVPAKAPKHARNLTEPVPVMRPVEIFKPPAPSILGAAEGIPAYPRRRRAGRVVEPEKQLSTGDASQIAQAATVSDERAAQIAHALQKPAQGMEDWARRVVERGAAVRVTEHEETKPLSEDAEAVAEQLPVQLLPVESEAVPETIDPEPAMAAQLNEELSVEPAVAAPIEVAESIVEPPAAESLMEIATAIPASAVPKAASLRPEAILKFAAGPADDLDRSIPLNEVEVVRETGCRMPMGALADLEVTAAEPPKAVACASIAPIEADTAVGGPRIPEVAQVRLTADMATPAELLPVRAQAANPSFSQLEDVVVSSNEPAVEPEADVRSGLEVAPPEWPLLEAIEPRFDSEAGGALTVPALVDEKEMVEQAAEALEPPIEEVVRVRVLDEGDLIALCGLQDIDAGSGAAVKSEIMTPNAEPLQFEASRIEGVVKIPQMGAVRLERPLTVAHVDMAPEFNDGIDTADLAPPAAVDATGEQSAAVPATSVSGDQTLEPVFVAPPVNEEIEPVHGYERFLDVDTDLELNTKVVQMPSPVAFVDPGQQSAGRIPRGIHDRQTLSGILERQSDFKGVVFLLGLLGYEHLIAELGQAPVKQSVDAANEYFDSLLGDTGFGCWAEESTFLMLLPAVSPEEAREVSQQTAEALWDYQLRSLGSTPLIFHWGCSIVEDGRLAQSIELAKDEMLEAGRARKRVLSASGRFRRKVVNG